MTVQVSDVLGLMYRFVNPEVVVLSIRPRKTTVFSSREVFLLSKKKKDAFDGTPEEFFCVNLLNGMASDSSVTVCQTTGDACCCAAFIDTDVPTQDIRVSMTDCGFERKTSYHTAGLVEGDLLTAEGTQVPARLRSEGRAEFDMPDLKTSENKKPVTFDLVILTDFSGNHLSDTTRLKQVSSKVANNVANSTGRIRQAMP